MPLISKGLLILAAVVVGWFAVDSYLSTRALVDTLRDENATLTVQLEQSRKQHEAENAIGQWGLAYSQQGQAQQEKTQIEIRKEIIREPCATQPLPDAGAQRLWKLAEDTRAPVLRDATVKPDSVPPGTPAGK
ncbi:hypothetical protein [Enterobacter kobei]|uniref:hypothetical protein n=1 Tax=Enterobacter kobei TaxID=208224 RepID=UPI003CF7CE8A